jgi:hypothetical protein
MWPALVVSAAVIAGRELQYADVRFDRFHVPAFDGRVYLAMAEHPGVFTVAPWGHRVLLPWLLSVLPLPSPVPAFFWSTALGLIAAGVLLFFYLRRLGHGAWASLLAVVLFGASGPVGEVVRYQFLVEPLTLALALAFLLALEAGAGVCVVALLALLGTLSKEFFLLLLPLVYLVLRPRLGHGTALRNALLTALPAVAATLLLRLWWTPHIAPPVPTLSGETLRLALERARDTWPRWWPATLLLGLTPAAVLGALRVRARPLVLPAAYLFLATLVSPFLNPVAFFAADIRRLLLYALPGVLALALVALDRVWPHLDAAPAPTRQHPAWNRAAGIAVVAVLALPLLVADRYRRLDLQGSRDSLRVLAVCRETLRTAQQLESGGRFVFDPGRGRFSQPAADEGNLMALRRVRWFLADGWGAAQREAGDAVLQGRAASLILPSLRPRDLEATLALRAASETRVAVGINGERLGELRIGSRPSAHRIRVPARWLFRGDNQLMLSLDRDAPAQVRLQGLTLVRAGGAS